MKILFYEYLFSFLFIIQSDLENAKNETNFYPLKVA